MKTTEFPHRKIWRITYPVLISLLMEHLIGMTDTAFMGHVGEVELGASAIAGIYYMVLYMPVSYTHLVAHLSAQFKRVTGLSPSAYKRAGRPGRLPLDKV